MIRSLIGIVFVLVSATTCVPSIAAPTPCRGLANVASGELPVGVVVAAEPLSDRSDPVNQRLDELRTDGLRRHDRQPNHRPTFSMTQGEFRPGVGGPLVTSLVTSSNTSLVTWLGLANGQTERRLTAHRGLRSPVARDDFRFRASPIKGPRNWRLPMVNVRSAKMIGIANDATASGQSKFGSHWIRASIANIVPTGAGIGRFAMDRFEGVESIWQLPQRRFDRSVMAAVDRVKDVWLGVVFDGVQNLAFFSGGTGDDSLSSISKPSKSNLDGQTDYWGYYADCDRWNVVFAKADQRAGGVKVVQGRRDRSENFAWRTFNSAETQFKKLLTAVGIVSSKASVNR